MRKSKSVKARIFYNLNLKVFALQQWKEFAKKAKIQKEILQKERAIEEDTIKKYLALKYRERNICLKIFQAWAMFSKIQTRKRKFEALNCRKETSRKKVDDFLNSLENISTTSNDWIRQKLRKEKEKPQPSSYSMSLRRLVSKASNSEVVEGKETQLPKIQLKDCKQNTLKSKGKVDETYVLQREIINAQRQKMREQWKQIESLKEQKTRLENHRPATDCQLVKKIERKILLETEDSLEESREGPVDNTEAKSETAGSECTYSEDFEECSSEAPSSSLMTRTPEMVRRVREREEVRAVRREEIRRLHQERVEQERERLRLLKEKEVQDEMEERRKTRELWKKKRRDEMERDKRRIAETERQERMSAVAEEFQRKMIMKQFGLRPWRKLVSNSREKQLGAQHEFDLRTKRSFYILHGTVFQLFSPSRKFLERWLGVVRERESLEVERAETWARQRLLRKCWSSWREVGID